MKIKSMKETNATASYMFLDVIFSDGNQHFSDMTEM